MALCAVRRLPETIVDPDSVPPEVFGRQLGSGWNGH